MTGKQAALGAHVRRLCSSGLDPKVVIPPVVAALREIAQGEWGMFYFSDEHCDLSDLYSENPAAFDVLPAYMEEIHNAPAQDAMGVQFTAAMRRGRGFGNSVWWGRPVYEGPGYDCTWRPLQIYYALEQTATFGGRGFGSVEFLRTRGSRPFHGRNEADLAVFSHHLAHALTAPCAQVTRYSARGMSGVLVFDATGQLLLSSPDALRCIALADNASVAFSRKEYVPVWLHALVAHFVRLWRGHDGAPCRIVRRNRTGVFRICGYRCNETALDHDRLAIAVHVEHHAPLALEVETLGYRHGLSARQRQLCGYLLNGLNIEGIARRMSVKQSTVIGHARELYKKLEIHDRDGLDARFPSLPRSEWNA
jgi:DNA-binding CsgD family transcriptional regulator